MKLNKYIHKIIINMMFLFLVLSLLSMQYNYLIQEQNQTTNIENNISFIYRNKKIHIIYSDNTINIYKDSSLVKSIEYLSDFGNPLPINGLIINNKIHDYFILDEDILLLPLKEVNDRLNMLCINLQNMEIINFENSNDFYIKTSFNWFYLNKAKCMIVAANSFNYEGNTEVRFYIIDKKKVKLTKTEELRLTFEMKENFTRYSNYLNANL